MTPWAVAGRLLLGAVIVVGASLAAIDPITLGTFLAFAVVGGFLAHRRPRTSIGWILIGIGLTFIGTSTPASLDVAGLEAGTAALRDVAHAWVGVWSGGLSFILYATLAATFPTGHLPNGRWGRIAAAALAVGVFVVLIPAFTSTLYFSLDGQDQLAIANPLGVLPDPPIEAIPALQVIVTAVPLAILAGSVIGLLVGYRRATGIEALQVRWLLASVALVLISVVFGLVGFVASGMTNGVFWIPALLAYPSVALAVGIAVMRYRLFEIDRIISRTITYALVTAVLFATFASVTIAIQTALGPLVGGDTLSVAISTLAVAASFQPVRQRLQGVIDRRFNRQRYDRERALDAFVAGLRDEVDGERLDELIGEAVADAVQPRAIAVWRRGGIGIPR